MVKICRSVPSSWPEKWVSFIIGDLWWRPWRECWTTAVCDLWVAIVRLLCACETDLGEMSRVCVCTALSAVVELAGVLMEMLVRSLRRNALAVDARMTSVHSIASGRRLCWHLVGWLRVFSVFVCLFLGICICIVCYTYAVSWSDVLLVICSAYDSECVCVRDLCTFCNCK